MRLNSSGFVVPTVASCFDLVVHCHRDRHGRRRVSEILAIGNRVENGVIETYPVFAETDGALLAVAAEAPAAWKFERAGHRVSELLADDGPAGAAR
ncbi:CpaF/VirB11 family protein [Kocuria rosea]|uniref:CpaF/VirB11 family protein n=1 Tax=Kocuria rosea TaxID=1275 RepID=UPI00203E8851|nr:CpaF/VirB11 family protein [Kocuria rosea]